MRWKLIQKKEGFQPSYGTYSDWKELLSVEGEHQCVYCCVHESSMGGIRNFHVEHYRPKSKFESLTNNYSNLFYACPICNVFKSNDWPNEPATDYSFSTIHYPDPSKLDYNHLFDVDTSNYVIKGKNVTGIYIEKKLFLNRPQLISERKLQLAISKSSELLQQVYSLASQLLANCEDQTAKELLREYLTCANILNQLKDKLFKAIPYKLADIQRPQ